MKSLTPIKTFSNFKTSILSQMIMPKGIINFYSTYSPKNISMNKSISKYINLNPLF